MQIIELSKVEYVLDIVGNNVNSNVKLTINQSKNAEIVIMEGR